MRQTVYLDFGERVLLTPIFSGMEHLCDSFEGAYEDSLEGKQFLIKGASELVVVFYPERATCNSPWECQPAEVLNAVWKSPVIQGSTEDIVEYLSPVYPLTPAKIIPLKEPLSESEIKELERKRLNRVKGRIRFMKKVKREHPDWLVFPLTLSTLWLNYHDFQYLKRDYGYFERWHGEFFDEDRLEESARDRETQLVFFSLLSLKEALIRNGFEKLVELFIPSPEKIDSYTTAVFLGGEKACEPVYWKVELVDEIKKELKERLLKEGNK